MSAVVKTVTPFLDKESLLKALDKLNISYTSSLNSIKLQDNQFVYINGHYTLDLYSYNYKAIKWNDYKKNTFLDNVEKEYNYFCEAKIADLERKKQEELAQQERIRIEQELKKIEEEKKAFVEKQKNEIIAKAKAKGYSVKEKIVNKKVKLILVRHTY
ncbi:hypothetical protein [Tenacibaculum dicentrarchi]|uniref:hypothetical protein n=1 Tax=Tenacibaculum dicentrarchi TaxID=669041 RepID=UPI0035154A14